MSWDSKISDDIYRAALKRVVEAKWKMDDVQKSLDRAETEYHEACQALDELENAAYPAP